MGGVGELWHLPAKKRQSRREEVGGNRSPFIKMMYPVLMASINQLINIPALHHLVTSPGWEQQSLTQCRRGNTRLAEDYLSMKYYFSLKITNLRGDAAAWKKMIGHTLSPQNDQTTFMWINDCNFLMTEKSNRFFFYVTLRAIQRSRYSTWLHWASVTGHLRRPS